MREFYSIPGNGTKVYCSQRQEFVARSDAQYVEWLKGCSAIGMPNVAIELESVESAEGRMRALFIPPYHRVSTYRVIRRLEEAGVATQALAMLEANPVLKARFYALPDNMLPADDENARALIMQAGADPDEILAPE